MLVIFLLTVSFVGQAQDTKVWSLEQCIAHAWENNLQLQQQKLAVDLSRQNLTQTRANMLPNLNANASHAYNYGRTVDPFTNQFETESVQSNNFGISSGITLFSGFQIQNAVRQGRLELEAGKLDLERSYNDVALAVAGAYMQILFSRELLENAANQVEISQQQVARTQNLVAAGSLARGALLTIEAQLATEELQLVNARNQLDMAYLNLMQMLFLAQDDHFEIETPQLVIDPQDQYGQSPMQIYQQALDIQPEIRASAIRIQSAERGLAMARGSRSPTLSLRGSLGSGYSEARWEITETLPGPARVIGFTQSGEDVLAPTALITRRVQPFEDQLRDNLGKSLGFSLTIPLFNSLQTHAAIGRSKINLDNARLNHQIARDQLFRKIQQAHADSQAALKRYYATEKNVTALREAFTYTEQRFDVGLVNSLEYNDAKNRLSAAQSELLQSKYEFLYRVKILDFYMGNPLML